MSGIDLQCNYLPIALLRTSIRPNKSLQKHMSVFNKIFNNILNPIVLSMAKS